MLSFRDLRGHAAALLLTLLGAVGCATPARAQNATSAPDWLRVERDAQAENCPDAVTLSQRVAALHSAVPTLAYVVELAREASGYRARIFERNQPSNVRVLTGTDCQSLGQAAAVALALLLDATPAPSAPPTQTASRVPDVADPRLALRAQRPLLGSLSVGAGVLLGVTRRVAPALLGELGLDHPRFRVALGVLGVPLAREAFGPGSLRSWMLGGHVAGCAPMQRSAFRADVCAGVLAGVIDVRARGYTRDARTKQLWLALPLGLNLRYALGPVRVGLAFEALIGLRRPDFSIDGLGSAFGSWAVSPLISLRLETGFPYGAR